MNRAKMLRVRDALDTKWRFTDDICERAGVSRYGNAYPELAELEIEGTVESKWALGPNPRRRMYRLAPESTETP